MLELVEAAVVLVVLLFFSIFSYKKKMLETEGILIGNIVGLLVYLLGNELSGKGLLSFMLVVIFFVVAEASTFLTRARGHAHEKRTTGNILGNSGAAILALVFGAELAFFGAIAAALADTLSSEIGLLSKKKPVLVTNFKRVEPGTDGGITLLGTAASLIGGLVIGAIHFYIYGSIAIFCILVFAGFFGSFADSVFGALFERKAILNNAQVNFLGSGAGALIAFAIASLI